MKLVTTAQQLRSALSLFRPIIATRVTYPVLSTVLFEDGTARGTNLDQELAVKLVASEAKGRIAIDYRTISRLVSLIPSDDVVTLTGSNDEASVSFSSGRYDLPCVHPDSFPEIEWGKPGQQIAARGLRSALKFVAPSISKEETRYYLNGASFQRDKDGVGRIVATDGHRMAVKQFDSSPWLWGKIVPTSAVRALAGMIEPEQIVQLPSDTKLRFSWPGMTLSTKLIDGSFPQWERVIPTYEALSTHHVTLSRSGLLVALRRLAAFGARRQGPAVTLGYDILGAVLSASVPDRGTAREFLRNVVVANVQTAQAVSFRSDYLCTILRQFAGHDRVRLDLVSSGAPIRVSAASDDYTILMPMRGGAEDLALSALAEVSEMGRAAA